MKEYLIVTDETCSLSAAELNARGIFPEVLKFTITLDGAELHAEDIDQFYELLQTADPAKLGTAAPGPFAYVEVLRHAAEITDPDRPIVFAGIGAALSGSAQMAQLAIAEISAEFPGREFIFVETACASNGLTLFLEELARYHGDDISAYATQLSDHLAHLFTIKDLSFAAKSGRFGPFGRIGLQSMSKLSLLPSMYFPCDANLRTAPVVHRGLKRVFDDWLDYYCAYAATPGTPVRIGYAAPVMQPATEQLAARFAALDADQAPSAVTIGRIDPLVGAHTGPTCLSLFFSQRDKRDSLWHKSHY